MYEINYKKYWSKINHNKKQLTEQRCTCSFFSFNSSSIENMCVCLLFSVDASGRSSLLSIVLPSTWKSLNLSWIVKYQFWVWNNVSTCPYNFSYTLEKVILIFTTRGQPTTIIPRLVRDRNFTGCILPWTLKFCSTIMIHLSRLQCILQI